MMMDSLDILVSDMLKVKQEIDERYEMYFKLIVEGREELDIDKRYLFDLLGVGKRLICKLMESRKTVFRGTELAYKTGGMGVFDFETLYENKNRIILGEIRNVVMEILESYDYIETRIDSIQPEARQKLIQYILSKREIMEDIDEEDDGYVEKFAEGIVSSFMCRDI